ncbi:glycosyltransferase family 2 protein [Salinimicrobium sp. TH3]|uniref:glycosyltransferase family 2 protein n=1 Tax=Salinimicrobium sp. TH3 TaxID=2997342 RepID=UPI0022765795|nr:glycosyltransferase family 2 protein [Salinimicrobium sp. TH3]MCY2687943.1 glycosyltransferase family 2 protein [Salinimicrobium sp. TH3]
MKVSVIIPAYNAQAWIGRCIQSVMAQTYKDLEIIVLNDGSTDETLQLLIEITEQDERVQVINKKNSGTYLTRKMGVKRSIGEAIFHADADDFLEPFAIEVLVKRMLKDRANLVIGNHFQLQNGKKRTVTNFIQKDQSRTSQLKSLFKNDLKGYVWGRLYRRELLTSIDFEATKLLQEDFLTNLLVILKNDVRIAVEETPVYNYLVHKNSANSSRDTIFVENVYSFIELTESILKEAGHFEDVKNEFELFKCRNWIVYSRLGGRLSRDKRFRSQFFKKSYTSNVHLHLAYHHRLEMMVYRYHHNLGRLVTRSLKQVDNLIN